MANKLKARVLCFPRSLLDEIGSFQGLTTDVGKYFPRIVTPPNCAYVPRDQAELDPLCKQVIPYVLFAHNGTIFSYRRGKRGSEGRLHELYSVGVGGHIEPDDKTLFADDGVGYQQAMWREVKEEVTLQSGYREQCVALINDDATEVGRVHFGIVHMVELREPAISKRESIITDAGLIPTEQAMADINRYETWSQLCLRHLDVLRCCHAAGFACNESE